MRIYLGQCKVLYNLRKMCGRVRGWSGNDGVMESWKSAELGRRKKRVYIYTSSAVQECRTRNRIDIAHRVVVSEELRATLGHLFWEARGRYTLHERFYILELSTPK